MKRNLFHTATILPLVFAAGLAGVACNDGALEEAGEDADEAIEDTKDAVDDAGDEVEDAVDDAVDDEQQD
jgi:hypothetical protein